MEGMGRCLMGVARLEAEDEEGVAVDAGGENAARNPGEVFTVLLSAFGAGEIDDGAFGGVFVVSAVAATTFFLAGLTAAAAAFFFGFGAFGAAP
jgi:hypothetical protein